MGLAFIKWAARQADVRRTMEGFPRRSLVPASASRRVCALVAALAFAVSGCAHGKKPVEEVAVPQPAAPSAEVLRRAHADRVKLLALENDRLRADLDAAEQTLVAAESGMRGAQTRTEAVSQLAEARIQVDRAAQRAPWRGEAIAEARGKLDEAGRQLDAGHIGSAIFFVSRASRIATTLLAEADRVGHSAGRRFVKGDRVNLRAEPSTESEVLAVLTGQLPVFPESAFGEWSLVRTASGQVGWIHASLLRAR